MSVVVVSQLIFVKYEYKKTSISKFHVRQDLYHFFTTLFIYSFMFIHYSLLVVNIYIYIVVLRHIKILYNMEKCFI